MRSDQLADSAELLMPIYVAGLEYGANHRQIGLSLTWWPLFRDCAYYIVGLIVLAAFAFDSEIVLYEASLAKSIIASEVREFIS